MEKEFELPENEAIRVLVLLHPGAAISKEEIAELLMETRVDREAITFVAPGEEGHTEADGQCVVIPIDSAVCDNTDLAKSARYYAQSASGLVVVLGKGFDHSGLHPIAEGYGTQCRWSPMELLPCLEQGEGPSPPPMNSDGGLLDRPHLNQVNCR